MSFIKHNLNQNLKPKFNAFPYQVEAFEAVKDLPYSAIFHEQGLGKTKIAIDLSLYWLEYKDIDTVLIVTKKQLIRNWQDEIKAHTHIVPSILSSNKGDNFSIFNGRSRIVLTNFETIISELERTKLFLECRNVAIIIDESTKLKNPSAKLTTTFFKLSDLFKIKVIMTGTPVANRPYDLWSQIYFLDKGKSLGKDFKIFKNKNDLSNKLADSIHARQEFENNVEDIFKKISFFSVRETKKTCGIYLPEKNYEMIYAKFGKHQKQMYDKVIQLYQIEINKNGESILDDDSECLKRLLRLNQITSNPRLIDEKYDEMSGKEVELDKLINVIIDRNEKVIVWSSFIENIDYFTKKYKYFGARKIHGGMMIGERNKSVEKFKTDKNCKILFATPQSAKEGLTLTVANNVIFYDRTFNLDDYLQAQDRIHRISQKKNCTIYNILIDDSIDDWIDALLTAKQQAAFLAQGDISRHEYELVADFSFGNIIKKILGR